MPAHAQVRRDEPTTDATRALRTIDLSRNPLADAQRDYEMLTDELKTAQREIAEAAKLNNAMLADVDSKNREIGRLERLTEQQDERCRMLQGFAVAMVTRLDTIGDIITKAKAEAWQQASSLGLKGLPTDDEPESDSTAELLPSNDMASS